MKKDKIKKCFTKLYTQAVVMHGGLMCWGGFEQPKCKYLEKCLNQFQEEITPRKFNNLLKRAKKPKVKNLK